MAEQLDEVATVVQRLAVLLSAGVTPDSSWRYLAESVRDGGGTAMRVRRGNGTEAGAAEVVARMARRPTSLPIAEAILAAASGASPAWRGLAAAWFVAAEAGASLSSSLHGFATSLRDLAATQRDIEVALAGPRATARLVSVLPVIGILFGLALGFDTLGTLFGTGPGLMCLGAGALLMLAAWAWNRRLLRGAVARDLTPGLALELVAIAVSGGASLDRARDSVARALAACDLSADHDALEEVLDLSRRAGVPAGVLLRSEAEQSRRVARSAAERQAASLSVTLMLPLGVCVLPAFLLLGVAPLMLSVISSTAIGW